MAMVSTTTTTTGTTTTTTTGTTTTTTTGTTTTTTIGTTTTTTIGTTTTGITTMAIDVGTDLIIEECKIVKKVDDSAVQTYRTF